MDPAQLLAVVDALKERTVAVIGDIVADEFVYGRVARVSREAPVLILEYDSTQVVPGAGGNAANNVAALGGRAILSGIVGRDEHGRRLSAALDKRVDHRGVVRAANHHTPVKTRILAGGIHSAKQQVVRIDRAVNGVVTRETRALFERRTFEAALKADAVLVSDYGLGLVTPAFVSKLRTALRREGRPIPILVDSRYRVLEYRGLTACTPNESEVEQALGVRINDDLGVLEKAGRALLEQTGTQAVLITRGGRGMALFVANTPTVHIPIFGTDEIADVTGAGDTVMATMALALAAGTTFEAAARLANYAGGIVVMKRGTATASAEEIRRAVRSDAAPDVHGGGARVGEVVSRESLVARVRQAHESGRTVAFANGCFDLLHVGHVRYLEAAAQEADVLVVALNDDRSVRDLKGEGRPILAAEYRAELVAALRCVDFVTVFQESTVGPLLELLHPDVHCKGTDYTVDTVPERDVVRAYGGRIAIVGDPKDHSTRDLLARIASTQERTEPGVSQTAAKSATKS